MNTLATKKITLTTVKSFIKNNEGNLLINVKSDFEGMTDCVERRTEGWREAVKDGKNMEQTMGIPGAWFVREGRDGFEAYDENGYTGIYIYNACGSFILAIKK